MSEDPTEAPAQTLPATGPNGAAQRDNPRRPSLTPLLSTRVPGTPTTATTAANTTPPGAQPAPGQPAPPQTTGNPPPPTGTPASPDVHSVAASGPSPGTPPSAVPAADPNDDNDGHDPDHPADVKPPINPGDAIGMLSGLAQPLLGIPAALAGMGSGLLAPFTQILQQFGQGTPAMPDSGGFPQGVADRLAATDASSAMTGLPGTAYQSDVDQQANQATAMDNLERKLHTALDNSAANSKLGRGKIEQIIAQVKSALQAMAPIANTPTGQLGILSTISQGLTQAGAVLSNGVTKDGLNKETIQAISTGYVNDLNAARNDDQHHAAAGGGPDAWAVRALAANGITDPRAVANWLPGLRTIGQRESGNNPRAVNGSDGNAARGTPSMGWMQTIRPTFEAHHRPGTSRDILDPVANAAAAIHYIMTRYQVSPSGHDLMANVQQANPYAPPKGY